MTFQSLNRSGYRNGQNTSRNDDNSVVRRSSDRCHRIQENAFGPDRDTVCQLVGNKFCSPEVRTISPLPAARSDNPRALRAFATRHISESPWSRSSPSATNPVGGRIWHNLDLEGMGQLSGSVSVGPLDVSSERNPQIRGTMLFQCGCRVGIICLTRPRSRALDRHSQCLGEAGSANRMGPWRQHDPRYLLC